MITIKATFTGVGSLGYVNGKEYELRLPNKQGISIVRTDGSGKCPYSSLSSFFKNWTNIQVLYLIAEKTPIKEA